MQQRPVFVDVCGLDPTQTSERYKKVFETDVAGRATVLVEMQVAHDMLGSRRKFG